MKYDEIIEIYTGTLWESEMITSLLKDSEIQSFLKNNILESYAYEPIYATGVKVMILSSDFDKAKEIVDSYLRNSTE
jgi:hypothetical protein